MGREEVGRGTGRGRKGEGGGQGGKDYAWPAVTPERIYSNPFKRSLINDANNELMDLVDKS